MKKISTLAKFALLLATIIWGTSFVIIKDTVNLITPNYLMAIRFTGAVIILGAVFFKRLKNIKAHMLWQGAVIGVLLYLAYLFQTLGIMQTTPGKNAFLTAFYCVLVPFIVWATRGARPDKWNMTAALMCVSGIGLISLESNLSMGIGDFLTLVGGFFFACHMVAVARFTKDSDPIVMTILQFVATAICFWTTTFCVEGAPVPVSASIIPSVIYLCVFCTAAALLLQNFGQKHTTASAASLLLSLEAVFGTLISVIMGREELTFRVFSGFALIFLAIVVSETKLSFLGPGEKERI